jgi:WXXGXW repeat (2 copies)
MKRTALVVAFLLIGGSVVAAQTSVSIGIQIGPPPPPRVVYVAPPPPPEPEVVWVEGYWYPSERHYVWHDGYWTRPPYSGARWVPARHDGRVFYVGYWDGPRGRVIHDHHWDGHRDRDHGRKGPGKGRGRGR